MESSGRPGSVQLSDATLALSGLDPALVPSRVVDIRGKGEMHTFVLDAGSQEALGARATLDADVASTASDEERQAEQPSERISSLNAGGDDAMSDGEGPPLRSFAPAGAGAADAPQIGPGSVSSGGGKGGGDATEGDAAASKRAHAHAISALLLGTCGPLGFCTFWCIFMPPGGNPAIVAAGWLLGCSFVAALPLLAACHQDVLPARLRLSRPLVLRLCLAACLGCDLVGHGLAQQAWCARVAPGPACSLSFFFDFHAVMGATAPLTSMLPLHLALVPELARFGIFLGTALTWHRAQLTAALFARMLLYGASSLLLTPLLLVCAVDVPAGVHDALAVVETCPARLQPARDRVAAHYARLRSRCLGDQEPPLLERTGLAVFGLRVVKVIYNLITADGAEIGSGRALRAGCRDLNATLLLVIAASALSRVSLRTAGSSVEAAAAAQRLRVAAVLRDLQEQLASARSEASSLAAGCAALGALFPSASAVAVGAFAQGASFGVLSGVELSAADERARAALAAALPPDVGGTSGTSVHRACRVAARGATSAVLDSRDCEGGVADCADWAAALEGVAASRALTLPLTAGPMVVGFATVYLSLFHADDNGAAMHAVLREAAGVIGGALFVRRAFAINRDGEARPASRDTPTPRRVAAAAAADGRDAVAPYPANDADDAVLALLDARSATDCATLESWALDAQSLSDEDKHRLLAAMLHSLGLFRRFRLSPTAFADFVTDTATHYSDNPFHHFAQCVPLLCFHIASFLLLLTHALSVSPSQRLQGCAPVLAVCARRGDARADGGHRPAGAAACGGLPRHGAPGHHQFIPGEHLQRASAAVQRRERAGEPPRGCWLRHAAAQPPAGGPGRGRAARAAPHLRGQRAGHGHGSAQAFVGAGGGCRRHRRRRRRGGGHARAERPPHELHALNAPRRRLCAAAAGRQAAAGGIPAALR